MNPLISLLAQTAFDPKPVEFSSGQWIALVIGAVGGFFTLVYWLVRQAFKRQSEITDRYFNHLERKDEEQRENIKLFGESMERMGKAMDEQTSVLKGLHEKMERQQCRYRAHGGGQ